MPGVSVTSYAVRAQRHLSSFPSDSESEAPNVNSRTAENSLVASGCSCSKIKWTEQVSAGSALL